MKTAKLLLAAMIFFVVASSIGNADSGIIPTIKILKSINVGSASAGNGVPVYVQFRVDNIKLFKPTSCCICGLDDTNFYLEPVEQPYFSPFVGMDHLTQGAFSRVPHLCYYTVSIRPTSLHPDDPEYTRWWTKGDYVFKLNYESGKATASKVFSFTIP